MKQNGQAPVTDVDAFWRGQKIERDRCLQLCAIYRDHCLGLAQAGGNEAGSAESYARAARAAEDIADRIAADDSKYGVTAHELDELVGEPPLVLGGQGRESHDLLHSGVVVLVAIVLGAAVAVTVFGVFQ